MEHTLCWPRKAWPVITGMLFLVCAATACGSDIYIASDHQLNISQLEIENGTYGNVVVTLASLVSGPTGNSPNGSQDIYNPFNYELTVQSVLDGSATLYNLIVTVKTLDSIGSVTGVDTYNAGELSIPSVQVLGGPVYSNVVIAPGNILSAGGGMPASGHDIYNPSTGILAIAAVQLGSKVYTNAMIKVKSVLSVGGNDAALIGSYYDYGYFHSSAVTQPPTPPAGSRQAAPLGFTSSNYLTTFDGVGGFTASGTLNSDGTGSADSFSGTYSMNSASSFTLANRKSGDVYFGHILPGGSMVTYSKMPGNVPSLNVATKFGGPSRLSNASLNGSYGLVSYFYSGAITQPPAPPAGSPQARPLGFNSSIATMNFDGIAHWTIYGTANMDGTASALGVSGTYSVNPAGMFTLTTSGTPHISVGYIQPGAGVISFSHNPGDVPGISVGVKTGGSGFSNASLNGPYGLVTYSYNSSVTQPPTPATGSPQANPRGFNATDAAVNFDGAGHFSASSTTNTDGAGSAGSYSGTYSVNPAGLFTLSVNGSTHTSSGYLLAGGSAFNFSNNPGDFPSIGFGVAQYTNVTADVAPIPEITRILGSPQNAGNVPEGPINVLGAGFVLQSVITVAGTARPTSFMGATSLMFTPTLADYATPAMLDVTVTNPPPGGQSNNAEFIINGMNNFDIPTVSSVSPSQVIPGSGAFTLTVTLASGGGGYPGEVAQLNGQARATTEVNVGTLSASILASDVASPGILDVSVFNPDPVSGGTSNFLPLVVAPTGNPTLSEITDVPNRGNVHAGGPATTVEVDGAGFISSTVVVVGGYARETAFVNTTELQVTLLPEDIAKAGTIYINAVTPPPGGNTSGAYAIPVM